MKSKGKNKDWYYNIFLRLTSKVSRITGANAHTGTLIVV